MQAVFAEDAAAELALVPQVLQSASASTSPATAGDERRRYLPATQSVHFVLDVSARYLPAAHRTQAVKAVEPAGEILPATHPVQSLSASKSPTTGGVEGVL